MEAMYWLSDRGFGKAPKRVTIAGNTPNGPRTVSRKWHQLEGPTLSDGSEPIELLVRDLMSLDGVIEDVVVEVDAGASSHGCRASHAEQRGGNPAEPVNKNETAGS